MICKLCSEVFSSKDKRRLFCSRSCSATYSNKFGDRPVSQNRRPCPDCGQEIRNKNTKTCIDCRAGRQHRETGFLKKKDVNRERISAHARRVIKEHLSSCKVCGYDFAVEAAHVKPVKEFSGDATIEEINRIENLLPLCPNHHLEFDRGKLTLETILSVADASGSNAAF